MFISSKKSYEVCGNGERLVIPAGYIGDIPNWAAKHWLIQSAICDGSVATPEGKSDAAIEAANRESLAKAEARVALTERKTDKKRGE